MKLADHIKAKYILGLATIAFVQDAVATAIANLVASAPSTLDTLKELADALGDDPNFATTVTTSIATKAPLTGSGASGTWAISITGNAATASSATTAGTATLAASATKLATARNINGVPFDGTSNITVTAVATSGHASDADKLTTARNINGVSFDGTAAITVPAVDTATPRVAKVGDTMSGTLEFTQGEYIRGHAVGGFISSYNPSTGLRQGYIQWNHGGQGANFSAEDGNLLSLSTASNTKLVVTTAAAGEVVIGPGSTAAAFSVPGTRANVTINSPAGDAILAFGTVAATNSGYVFHTGTDMIMENAVGGGGLQFGVSSFSNAIYIDLNGKVAVGGAVPGGAKLSMIGNYQQWGDGAYRGYIGAGNALITGAAGTDLGIYVDSGNLLFGTGASVERMRIDTSGNIGIGQHPTSRLDVGSIADAANTVSVNSNAAGLSRVVANSSGTSAMLMTVNNSGTGDQGIVSGTVGLATIGAPLAFATGGAERMRISAAGVITESATGFELGYKDIPRNVVGLTRGGAFASTTGYTLGTGFPAGLTCSGYNDSGSAFTITQGSGLTLRLGGTATTGSRTIAPRTFYTIWANSTTEYIIAGAGVT